MTTNADQHWVLFDDALSGGLALTLPARVSQLSAVQLNPLNCGDQVQPPFSPANAAGEIAALVALATALGESPHTVCQVLADNVLALLKAGSAGVSVLDLLPARPATTNRGSQLKKSHPISRKQA